MITNTIRNQKNKTIANVRMAGNIKKTILKYQVGEVVFYGSNWNGYGYKDKTYIYTINGTGIKKLKEILNKPKKERKSKTEEEIILSWCKRLSKLSTVSFEDAKTIALEKINYKIDKINEMIMRDDRSMNASIRRGKLISKMERENPLRRIKDADHAYAILSASRRHNETNYDEMLEEARELASIGEIDKNEVKEYARKMYQ